MFPNAERIGRETVTLPLFPAMRDSDVDRVVDAVNQVLGVTA
jgi:dTDP-4-amino-4,6-dideoxygalactose transaminase